MITGKILCDGDCGKTTPRHADMGKDARWMCWDCRVRREQRIAASQQEISAATREKMRAAARMREAQKRMRRTGRVFA